MKRKCSSVILGAVMLLTLLFGSTTASAAVGGPVLLDGGDFPDHGCINGGALTGSWQYAEAAVANIGPAVTRAGNDGSIALLGGADTPQTCSDGGGNYHYLSVVTGISVSYYNGAAAINQFFTDLGSGSENPAIIVTAGTGSGGDLDSSEGTALTANAVAIADFVNSGGGLIGHGSGPRAFGWLNTLLPGITFASGCQSASLSLTPEGIAAFPGLTNGAIRSGPCHGQFAGDLGGLQVLGKDGANRQIILGGASVTLPGSLNLDPPTAVNPVGTTHTVTATVRDSALVPLAGETVTFVVTGANSGSGSGVTDANGEATFTYTGTTAGTDTITASYTDATGAVRSVTAEKIWEVTDVDPPVTVKTWTVANASGWNNGDIVLTFNATDTGSPASGVAEIHVLVNGVLTVLPGDSGSITLSGDGTYDIEFWAVDNAGNVETSTTQSHRIDSSAPVSSCNETVNPSGNNVPKAGANAGQSGQNPDGFYVADASDAGSGLASLVLRDMVSGLEVSLTVGDTFKLTQAPGVEPNVKQGVGDLDWKIQFNGDAELVAGDVAGNVTVATCLVPQPAK